MSSQRKCCVGWQKEMGISKLYYFFFLQKRVSLLLVCTVYYREKYSGLTPDISTAVFYVSELSTKWHFRECKKQNKQTHIKSRWVDGTQTWETQDSLMEEPLHPIQAKWESSATWGSSNLASLSYCSTPKEVDSRYRIGKVQAHG